MIEKWIHLGRELVTLRTRDAPVSPLGHHAIDKSPTGIQQMINKISEDSKRYGMRINTDKTKTMVNCRSMIENDMKIVLNGKALENVDSFICWGSLETWNNE